MVEPTSVHEGRLQSHHPLEPVARMLLSELSELSIRTAQ